MMKSDHPFLGMKAPGEHEREAENIKIQAGLDALAQETFGLLDWDLMDPILGF